jgi:all-trans-retinol dehydrogenase (NAD+)
VSEIRNQTIVVTGGASGMGRLVALKLARLGGRLVIWDIDATALQHVVAELTAAGQASAHGYVCDVSSRESVGDAAAQVRHDVGPVDIVINSAGIVSGRPFLDLTESEIEHTLGVNTLALFWTAQEFLPDMMAAGKGHLVTIASAAGTIGVAGLADYCASKWAAVGLDEALRVELKQRVPGVKTTIVCPYFVDTGMFRGVKTRFPLLLPILREDRVAERIVRAIRRNQPRLMMPWLVHFVPLLRMLPLSVFDALANILGINVAMKHFQGRTTAHAEAENQVVS